MATDIDTGTTSIELLHAALQPLGFSAEAFILNDEGYTRFIAPNGAVWLMQDAHISYPFTTAAVQRISRDKHTAHAFAATLDVQSPVTTQVVGRLDITAMKSLLQAAPLVVKPSNSSLSNGVTLQVRTLPMLENALAVAHAFSSIALVQKQVEGDEVRFVVIDGTVQAAILRQTPRVIGDGTHTLRQLIHKENKDRAQLSMPYLNYPQLDQEIIDFANFDLGSVPEPGQVVELGRGSMIKTGASIYNIISEIDPSYLQISEKLVNRLGASFIVVDMIIQNYHKPATKQNYAFLEFNTAPVLKLFYSCRDGKHFDVLKSLAPMIDRALKGKYA